MFITKNDCRKKRASEALMIRILFNGVFLYRQIKTLLPNGKKMQEFFNRFLSTSSCGGAATLKAVTRRRIAAEYAESRRRVRRIVKPSSVSIAQVVH
jgi:hypothetical protein